jgi:hypothetical protein
LGSALTSKRLPIQPEDFFTALSKHVKGNSVQKGTFLISVIGAGA